MTWEPDKSSTRADFGGDFVASDADVNVNAFQGELLFDEVFEHLVITPASEDGTIKNRGRRSAAKVSSEDRGSESLGSLPLFEAEGYSRACRVARKKFINLCYQVDDNLGDLRHELESFDANHEKKFIQLEEGAHALLSVSSRLDTRLSAVCHTAVKIGGHLQKADQQKSAANDAIQLTKYLMEFNSSPLELMKLSPLFSDDARVVEAAAVALKLRLVAGLESGAPGTQVHATPSLGLEAAFENLQEYCSDLENRLLSRFSTASQRHDLIVMAECAKILSQFNQGKSVLQLFIASRSMFMDAEFMYNNAYPDKGSAAKRLPDTVTGLSETYKDIAGTVRKEADVISAVFPSPQVVLTNLVERVLEQLVVATLENLLSIPSLMNPIPMDEGGYQQYLRLLAGAYERTHELVKELCTMGSEELSFEGWVESLFSPYLEVYLEIERASLSQLFQSKMVELNKDQGSKHDTAVDEIRGWNEEAVSRCVLFTPQAANLAMNVKAVFLSFLDQVNQYTTEQLEKAIVALDEAAQRRNLYSVGFTVSRRVAAAATTAAEAAASAGERAVRGFMVAVYRATTNATSVQQYLTSISRLLLPLDGTHAACCEQMALSMANSERAALKGLQLCIDTIMAEVNRILFAEQRATDFKPAEHGSSLDHQPTSACIKVISYMEHMLDLGYESLEGLNKQAFLTELGNRLNDSLLIHWQRFTFSVSGGLRLKRDVAEYAEFVRSFKVSIIDEKFEFLGTLANVLIVSTETLPSLIDNSLKEAREDAVRFVKLREDFKLAKLENRISGWLDKPKKATSAFLQMGALLGNKPVNEEAVAGQDSRTPLVSNTVVKDTDGGHGEVYPVSKVRHNGVTVEAIGRVTPPRVRDSEGRRFQGYNKKMDEFGGLVSGRYESKIHRTTMDDYGDLEPASHYAEGELGSSRRTGGKSAEANGKLWTERGSSRSGKGSFLKPGVSEFGTFRYHGSGEEREATMRDNASSSPLSRSGTLSELPDRVGDGVGAYSDDVASEERNDAMKETVGYSSFRGSRRSSRLYQSGSGRLEGYRDVGSSRARDVRSHENTDSPLRRSELLRRSSQILGDRVGSHREVEGEHAEVSLLESAMSTSLRESRRPNRMSEEDRGGVRGGKRQESMYVPRYSRNEVTGGSRMSATSVYKGRTDTNVKPEEVSLKNSLHEQRTMSSASGGEANIGNSFHEHRTISSASAGEVNIENSLHEQRTVNSTSGEVKVENFVPVVGLQRLQSTYVKKEAPLKSTFIHAPSTPIPALPAPPTAMSDETPAPVKSVSVGQLDINSYADKLSLDAIRDDEDASSTSGGWSSDSASSPRSGQAAPRLPLPSVRFIGEKGQTASGILPSDVKPGLSRRASRKDSISGLSRRPSKRMNSNRFLYSINSTISRLESTQELDSVSPAPPPASSSPVVEEAEASSLPPPDRKSVV